ncbi:MAG: hypothetical protein ACK4ZJ_08470 [Allorhizobium sp.]
MQTINSVDALETWGRVRLSKSFFMRDFLFSDIAAVHGLLNVPKDPALAIAAGSRLCEELLEPMQGRFGRIAIRSAYRSEAVNALGNRLGANCARNEANYAKHIWDRRDDRGHMGATACIIVPAFYDAFPNDGEWKKLAWWIHDHLPYSEMYFFRRYWAFNLTWSEQPKQTIHTWTERSRLLTKPGMANHATDHEDEWAGIERAFLYTD